MTSLADLWCQLFGLDGSARTILQTSENGRINFDPDGERTEHI